MPLLLLCSPHLKPHLSRLQIEGNACQADEQQEKKLRDTGDHDMFEELQKVQLARA